MPEFYLFLQYKLSPKRREKCHINSNVQEIKVKWKVRYLSLGTTKYITHVCSIDKKKI